MTAIRFPRGLYGITPEWADTDRLLQAIAHAQSGGMTALQWRRKLGPLAERRAQAVAVRALCAQLGLVFMINDDWQLALDLDAEGVHLGRDDGAIGPARAALGPGKLIGASCYDSVALAGQRLREGANYIAFGALFPSTTKPGATHATLEHIRAGRHLTDTQFPHAAVIAIGGIGPDNATPLIQAGADSIAIISALFDAADIQAAAQRCSALFS